MTERVEYVDGRVTVLRGDVREAVAQVPADSVDCIVTSPPFWRLRSYIKAGSPLKPLEIGGEATPEAYVAGLVEVFGLCRRALKPTGTLWVELGDSYTAGGREGQGARTGYKQGTNRASAAGADLIRPNAINLKPGDLCLIPARFSLAMQADGWTVRSVVIWHHISAMPEPMNGWRWEKHRVKVKQGRIIRHGPERGAGYVDEADVVNRKDGAKYEPCPGCVKCRPTGGYVLRRSNWRCTTGHSYIFEFARGERYFCDAEAAREPSAQATLDRNQYTRVTATAEEEQYSVQHDHETTASGVNPRSVWPLSPEPCKFAHYAAFPSGLPRKIIPVATPGAGCCPACGAPWAPVVEYKRTFESGSGKSGNPIVGKHPDGIQGGGETGDVRRGPVLHSEILGYRPTCRCPPATAVPAVVLDPFAGTGTTLAVAVELGRRAIGIELNPNYLPFIAERIAKAVQERRIEQGGTPLTGDPAKDADIIGPRTFF